MNKKAFTLAEVLITLGIIGVVAAMTIPNLMHKARNKILAVQFKKTMADVTQAIGRIKADNDVDMLADYCTCYDGSSYVNSKSCYEWFGYIFTSRSFQKGSSSWLSQGYDITRDSNEIRTYNGKNFVTNSALAGIGYAIFHPRKMLDGQYINVWIIESQLYFGVDINGSAKPNRLGHDIFVFIVNKKDDSLTYSAVPQEISPEDLPTEGPEYSIERKGYPCNMNSAQKANGIGCVYYALKDICPDGSGNGYFNCLPR